MKKKKMLSITSYLMFVSLKIADMAISIRAIQFLTGEKKSRGCSNEINQ